LSYGAVVVAFFKHSVFDFQQECENLSFPELPGRFWPTQPPIHGYRRIFPSARNGRGV